MNLLDSDNTLPIGGLRDNLLEEFGSGSSGADPVMTERPRIPGGK